MIGSLIRITSTPMEVEFILEDAQLEMQGALDIAFAQMHTTHAKVNIDSDYTRVQIDTYQARSSLGLYNSFDFAKVYAERARQHIMDLTAQAANKGGGR